MRRRLSSSVFVLFFVTATATQSLAKSEKKKPEDIEEVSQPEHPADEPPDATDSPSPPSVPKAPSLPTPTPDKAAEQSPGLGLPPPPRPLKLESEDGNTIKFGILMQPSYEAATRRLNDIKGWGQDLYLHRLRFIVGGTVFHDFDYFISTDYPDLFKQVNTVDSTGTPTYLKNFPGMNLSDAFLTYKAADAFKIDAGYMLPPMAHNAVQGAATLYGLDYFANTFLHKDAFATTANPRVFNPNANPLGRDLGVQFRGLLFRGLLEYRAGLFQGRREPPGGVSIDMPTSPGGRNMFRVAGRLQLNLLDPETGFFYAGTYLGAKRVLSVGASVDFQASYLYWAYDGLLDLPLGPGVVTAQVNLAQWDGGTWIVSPYLVKERALMAEAGYLIAPIRVSPIVRYEQRWVASTETTPALTEKRYSGGLAFWPRGHNVNLKLFYSRSYPNFPDTHMYQELNLQWQLYFF